VPKSKLALLLWLGASLLGAGCRGNSSAVPCESLLLIDLDLAGDGEGIAPVIDEVVWTITGNGMAPMMGAIDTSAPGTTPSVEVFGLGPGTYTVELEANSDDGETSCQGATRFDVTAGLVTEVVVFLRCTGGERFGGVRVNGKLNICPALTKVVVAPLQTSLGKSISVYAEALDPEGDDIDYSWSADSGTFQNPSAPDTVYTCEEPGEHQVTISVSDDGAKHCLDSWTVEVTCVGDGGMGGSGGAAGGGGTGASGGTGGGSGTGGSGANGGMGGSSGTGGSGANGGMGGSSGAGGSGASGGSGGASGMGGSGGIGGTGGVGASGGSGGTGGVGGSGGSGGGAGGMGGEGGSGAGGTDGGMCEITISLTGS